MIWLILISCTNNCVFQGSLEGDLDMESQLKMLENFKLQQQKPKKRVTIVTEEVGLHIVMYYKMILQMF